MDKTYQIATSSLDDIVKEAKETLRIMKSSRSLSGAWDCYCKISYDNIKITSRNCSNLKSNIEEAYNKASIEIIVNIDCKAGKKPPTIERR